MANATDSSNRNETSKAEGLSTVGLVILSSVLVACALGLLGGLFVLWDPVRPYIKAALITSTPVPTTQPLQSLLAASANWPVLLSDPFDDNKNGWETSSYYGNTFKASEFITNGKYQWSVEADHSPALDWELPELGDVSDFRATVQGQQTSGTSNGRYGLIFRWMSGQKFYLFDIADDQSFKLSLATKEDPGKTLLSGKSTAIKLGESNQLTVIGQGAHYTLFVNDQYVAELQDSNLTGGRVGLAVELLNRGAKVNVEFDNLEMRALRK